jgi:hypothetical protein
MNSMDPDQRTKILRRLADAITCRRLQTPVGMALDVIAPVSFLASQVALFVVPFTPYGRWREYVMALEDEDGWKVLRGFVDTPDS